MASFAAVLSTSASLYLRRSPLPRALKPEPLYNSAITPLSKRHRLSGFHARNRCIGAPPSPLPSPRLPVALVCFAEKDKHSGGEVSDDVDEASETLRGQSTMPERFRHLMKEVPDRPVHWPWAIVVVFLIYSWRTVLWELGNWQKFALAVANLFTYLSKLGLAFVFHFIGAPVTGLIGFIEFVLYTIRYAFANVVVFAPVPELTRVLLFSSAALAISETAAPGSIRSQQLLLTLSGVVAYGALSSFVPEIIFWPFLFGIFCFSRYRQKKDVITASLPSTVVLVAVGEPWVRILAFMCYLALAIHQLSFSAQKETPVEDRAKTISKLPLPIRLIALSIAIHLAATWVRHRHLTWMIA